MGGNGRTDFALKYTVSGSNPVTLEVEKIPRIYGLNKRYNGLLIFDRNVEWKPVIPYLVCAHQSQGTC